MKNDVAPILAFIPYRLAYTVYEKSKVDIKFWIYLLYKGLRIGYRSWSQYRSHIIGGAPA
jgi:hypothetical protein